MLLTYVLLVFILGIAHALRTNPLASVSGPAWDTFNQSVSGRLFNGLPVLAPCFSTVNGAPQSPDTQECKRVVGNQANAAFISDMFGGYATVRTLYGPYLAPETL